MHLEVSFCHALTVRKRGRESVVHVRDAVTIDVAEIRSDEAPVVMRHLPIAEKNHVDYRVFDGDFLRAVSVSDVGSLARIAATPAADRPFGASHDSLWEYAITPEAASLFQRHVVGSDRDAEIAKILSTRLVLVDDIPHAMVPEPVIVYDPNVEPIGVTHEFKLAFSLDEGFGPFLHPGKGVQVFRADRADFANRSVIRGNDTNGPPTVEILDPSAFRFRDDDTQLLLDSMRLLGTLKRTADRCESADALSAAMALHAPLHAFDVELRSGFPASREELVSTLQSALSFSRSWVDTPEAQLSLLARANVSNALRACENTLARLASPSTAPVVEDDGIANLAP